jgi:D-tyrosyl-tRNA(Tyr) deacylase
MKAVVQRARDASVSVGGNVRGTISRGLLVYLGIAAGDSKKEAEWMAEKIANLRIFEDSGGKMNLSLKDIIAVEASGEISAETLDAPQNSGGLVGVLAVSQFTLLADAGKGRRPYYGGAAEPEKARLLYEYFMAKVREQGLICEAGVFQAHMDVSYTNDGPVTIIQEI